MTRQTQVALAACLLALLAAGADGRRLLQLQNTSSTAPNIILFSHDDRLLEESFLNAHEFAIKGSGARNPNGCRIPMTWFINCCTHDRAASTCDMVQRAYQAGHEIATHTMRHSKETLNFTYEEWAYEVDGQRNWTITECGIPEEDVKGFRAPYFQVNELLGQVLEDLGWVEYDSSLKGEDPTGEGIPLKAGPLATPNPDNLPPYVPDCHESTANTCDGWAGLNLWEIPAYTPPGGGARRSDPVDTPGFTILQRFQADFNRKRGTGIPVGLNMHPPYLRNESNRAQVTQFFTWAFQQPNTWGMTFQQYIAWLKAGSPADVTAILAKFPCDNS